MADRHIAFLPDAISIGGFIAFVLGFVPFLNILGAYVGGLATGYVGEYGIVKGTLAGFAVGCLSLLPFVFYATAGVLALPDSLLALGGFFGGGLALLFAVVNPVVGAAGGFSLGIWIHLVRKVAD